MTKTGRAVVYDSSNTPFVNREYPVRDVSPDEAHVRITMSTICRSDIHSYQGHRPNPCLGILGHEIIGVIEQLGAEITHDMRGDPLGVGLGAGRPHVRWMAAEVAHPVAEVVGVELCVEASLEIALCPCALGGEAEQGVVGALLGRRCERGEGGQDGQTDTYTNAGHRSLHMGWSSRCPTGWGQTRVPATSSRDQHFAKAGFVVISR